jgi:hypothetical protein
MRKSKRQLKRQVFITHNEIRISRILLDQFVDVWKRQFGFRVVALRLRELVPVESHDHRQLRRKGSDRHSGMLVMKVQPQRRYFNVPWAVVMRWWGCIKARKH